MKKNLGHDQEDRGVEPGFEEVFENGRKVLRRRPGSTDGTGAPAAAEDALGGD
jgi:hypothetical protein